MGKTGESWGSSGHPNPAAASMDPGRENVWEGFESLLAHDPIRRPLRPTPPQER